jgi:hypothetical protein
VVLYQKPNRLLIITLLGVLVSHVSNNNGTHFSGYVIYVVAGLLWSYSEVAGGVNWFRRGLGVVVGGNILYHLSMMLR